MAQARSKASDTDILDALERIDAPVATTKEIADVLPIGDRHLRDRLKRLVEAGSVDTKKVGRSRVWWPLEQRGLPEDVERALYELEVPGPPEKKALRIGEVRACLKEIRRRGSASRALLIKQVIDHELVGYQSGMSAWKNLVEPALRELKNDVDELDVTPGEIKRWTWTEVDR